MTPERIGRYQILSEIKRGGMATVYLARDPRFMRDVAVKVLPPQYTHDPAFRARFEREAQTIAALEHPAIVPVYDFGEEDGASYLVMRYMSGGSLADRIKSGPLGLPETAAILSRLAPALDEVHARGIIHRDLKPANILFDSYGNAFLSDFGIAHLSEATTLTGEAIIGTPSYMSPEQARGDQEITGSSDIYAMGAILFEMLTGKVPYQATTPMGLVMKHLTDPVPRLQEVRKDLSPEFDAVISKAMAKEPGLRFATTSEMAALHHGIVERAAAQPQAAPDQAFIAEVNEEPDKPIASPLQPLAAKDPPNRIPARPQPASVGPVPKRTKRGMPVWAITLGLLALIGICGMLVLSAGGLVFFSQPDRAEAEPPQLTLDENLTVAEPPQETPVQAGEAAVEREPVTYFADNFSDPASGWVQTEDAGIYTGYYHDSYRIFVDRTYMIYWATPGLKFEDVTVEVDATKVGGADDNYFGLICRYQDEDNFYVFAIMSSGYYAVARIDNGEFKLIGMDGLHYNDAIHQGTTSNRLRADCIGDILTFYANGIKLANVEDDRLTWGDVGLTAAAFDMYGTDILFDNFVAQEP